MNEEATTTTAGPAEQSVLEKADALIKRRRVFLAGHRRPPTAPTVAADSDLPVLTEVVEPGAPSTRGDEEALAQRAAQWRVAIEQEVSRWLDEALPEITLSLLDDLADRLISRIDEHARQQLLPRLLAQFDDLDACKATDRGPGASL